MASINKLSIRGVRAFSPEDAEQVLEFYFPCTIIVGANGCGKTTIIESLKFAVCGSLPPGKNAGQAFVHDPKSVGQSTVKANIKMRFTNRAGQSMVVVRSMELQQKKTTMTFKQLDGVLRSTNADGSRLALSHKCSELDKQIPLLLGVSKAVLEHVVFCHQEEDSWPLQEGAVLKKRFDDIFNSARYTKALKVFADLKKEQTSKVKDIKVDVAAFGAHKQAAQGFRKELQTYVDQLEELEEQMEENKLALKETKQEEQRISRIMEEVKDLKADAENRKNDLRLHQQLSAKQKSLLKEDLTGSHSVRELKEMLRDFDARTENQTEKKMELEGDVEALQRDLEQLRKQETELQSKIGRLEAEKEAQEKRQRARYEKMLEISSTYGLGDALTQATQSQSGFSQNTSFANSSLVDISVPGSQPGAPLPEAVLEISQQEMEEFYRVLSKKEDELKDEIKQHKDKYQRLEEELNSQLLELTARQKTMENERKKLNEEQSAARKEIQDIGSHGASVSRLRKNDVEEAKKNAEKYAKERDDLVTDPRRNQIPIEIRSLEEKIDKLKREVEDDNMVLSDLRRSADSQNAINVLREQCAKDLEVLADTMKDQSFTLQQFNVRAPKELPGLRDGEDDHGDELTREMEQVVDDVRDKMGSRSLELSKINDQVEKLQQVVSEETALLSRDQRSLASKRATMAQLDEEGGSIDQIRGVVAKLRQFENEAGIHTPGAAHESKPQELQAYLAQRLEEEEAQSTEGLSLDVVKKLVFRLKKKVQVSQGKFVCPCCTRDLEGEEEIGKFQQQIKSLVAADSYLLKMDSRSQKARASYSEWKQVVDSNMNGVLDFRRIAGEVGELEKSSVTLEEDLSHHTRELEAEKEKSAEIQSEVDSLRDLLEATKRWVEAASRIAAKKIQVNQKKLDVSMSSTDFGGRDLRTVEEELRERLETKEQFGEKINRLNKEMSNLNNRINQVSTQATRMDKLAREKESQLAKELETAKRKTELSEKIAQCTEQEKKMQEDIGPLRQKIRAKESERTRLRSLNSEEEETLSSTYNSFLGLVKELKDIARAIDSFVDSNSSEDFEEAVKQSTKIAEKSREKQSQVDKIRPELDRLVKAAEDQESHRKNLSENIEIIQSEQKMVETKKEIAKLEAESGRVEGADTCIDDLKQLNAREKDLLNAIARLEGRRGEILESIRGLKRKLAGPEYKNVDEDHRVALIKMETTAMAARDLEKYHKALDRALLRYHTVKIQEINRTIRDLWNLTYKGQDITGIEIVSGQESGSRAQRSYNYRVVMTKNNTQMDMRGRCSAGQRVLASIVIRLALAETFCVNCGCIALDEPTVNLDYHNKRGLAVALADIIAARASQSNFQLILITHDEYFVSMMKDELSSKTGFSMPEKYFQVHREEGHDGKFYSKIDAIDWDQLGA